MNMSLHVVFVLCLCVFVLSMTGYFANDLVVLTKPDIGRNRQINVLSIDQLKYIYSIIYLKAKRVQSNQNNARPQAM